MCLIVLRWSSRCSEEHLKLCRTWTSGLVYVIFSTAAIDSKKRQTKYNAILQYVCILNSSFQFESNMWYVSVFTLDGSSAALTWSRDMNTVFNDSETYKHYLWCRILFHKASHYRCFNYFTYRLFSKKWCKSQKKIYFNKYMFPFHK